MELFLQYQYQNGQPKYWLWTQCGHPPDRSCLHVTYSTSWKTAAREGGSEGGIQPKGKKTLAAWLSDGLIPWSENQRMQ